MEIDQLFLLKHSRDYLFLNNYLHVYRQNYQLCIILPKNYLDYTHQLLIIIK